MTATIAVGAGTVLPSPATPVVSQAAIRLLDTVIGVGPSFDGLGLSIPLFFRGTTVAPGDSFHTVPYPAMIATDIPIISDLPGLADLPYWPHSLKQSERIGAGYLEQDIAAQAPDQKLRIIGMSQGTQVSEIVRARMAADPTYVADAGDYAFELIGDPYQPNGGILSRFTAFSSFPILGDLFPLGRPGPSDSPFQTTFYQNQYDGFADFPAYFNIPAIANAVTGILFEHVLPGYVTEPASSPNTVTTTVGNTTYVTYPQRLPLLAPLRMLASLVGAQRLVDALDPILRVVIEAGYDRTADPSQVKQFGWITPMSKIRDAIDALPDAFAQSLTILRTGQFTPTLPQPTVAPTEPATPTTVHPVQPVDTSPLAEAIRHVVVNLAAALTRVTRPLARLLQVVGGQGAAAAGPATSPVAPTSALPARVIDAVPSSSVVRTRTAERSPRRSIEAGHRRPEPVGAARKDTSSDKHAVHARQHVTKKPSRHRS